MLTMLSTGSHDLCGTRIEGLDQVFVAPGMGFLARLGRLQKPCPCFSKNEPWSRPLDNRGTGAGVGKRGQEAFPLVL